MFISGQLTKIAVLAASLLGSSLSTWTSYKYLVVKNVGEHIRWKHNDRVLDLNSEESEWERIMDGDSVMASRELAAFSGWREGAIGKEEKISLLRDKCDRTLKISRWDERYEGAIRDARRFCVSRKI